MSFASDSSEDSEWKKSKQKAKDAVKGEMRLHKKKNYSKKFSDKWLSTFHPWLSRCKDDPNKPFCRACQCRLNCNGCHLQRHQKTPKHARNLEILLTKGVGAGAARQKLQKERIKCRQRKRLKSTLVLPYDLVPGEEYMEEEGSDPISFQFVQAETDEEVEPNAHSLKETTTMKQEVSTYSIEQEPAPKSSAPRQSVVSVAGDGRKTDVKDELMKLVAQIQKDKDDLLDSFKELTSVQHQSTPPPPSMEKNHIDLFFDSISSSVKALSPKLVAEAKMGVLQLISGLELRALTESDVSAPATTTVLFEAGSDASTASTHGYIIHQPVTLLRPTKKQYEDIS